MEKIRLATVFSGIGAIEQALQKNGNKYSIVFACDNGERELVKTYSQIQEHIFACKLSGPGVQKYIKELYSNVTKPNFVKQSYFSNYQIVEEQWHEDIRFIDGMPYKDRVDLFVGGSPCQSFSNMGKRGGLEDTRGTLFYDFARLVEEIKPKVFIFENVPGMLNHDGGNTWNTIQSVFRSLGYKISVDLLNSKDFGVPQNRLRLYVVGFKDQRINFEFPKPQQLKNSMFDFLETTVDSRFYLGEKGFKFVTQSHGRAKVNEDIIRTQKANQQFNWNGDFFFDEIENITNFETIKQRAFVGEYKNKTGVIRQLTPRECLRLMGFSDTFKIVIPSIHMYRQAGNSIVVNVLQEIVKKMILTGVFK